MRSDDVVPVPMEAVAFQVDAVHLIVGDSPACGVFSAVQTTDNLRSRTIDRPTALAAETGSWCGAPRSGDSRRAEPEPARKGADRPRLLGIAAEHFPHDRRLRLEDLVARQLAVRFADGESRIRTCM